MGAEREPFPSVSIYFLRAEHAEISGACVSFDDVLSAWWLEHREVSNPSLQWWLKERHEAITGSLFRLRHAIMCIWVSHLQRSHFKIISRMSFSSVHGGRSACR